MYGIVNQLGGWYLPFSSLEFVEAGVNYKCTLVHPSTLKDFDNLIFSLLTGWKRYKSDLDHVKNDIFTADQQDRITSVSQ